MNGAEHRNMKQGDGMPSGDETRETYRFADDDDSDSDLGGFGRGKRSYDDDEDEVMQTEQNKVIKKKL